MQELFTYMMTYGVKTMYQVSYGIGENRLNVKLSYGNQVARIALNKENHNSQKTWNLRYTDYKIIQYNENHAKSV